MYDYQSTSLPSYGCREQGAQALATPLEALNHIKLLSA